MYYFNVRKGFSHMAPNNITSRPSAAENTVSFVEALEVFLSRLPVRSREIVAARFGILGSRPKTLEEIGRSYRITRERVRQIIGSSLGCISQERDAATLGNIQKRIRTALEERSGIMPSEELLKELAASDRKERGALLAFLECLSVAREEKETKEIDKAYVMNDFSLEEWRTIKELAKQVLVEMGHALTADEFFTRFKAKRGDVTREQLFDYLAVSREVRQNVFGKWGLTEWSDIKPRGTREKAHLVLKTVGKPLHFREIAEFIDEYGLHGEKRKSHPQTVHNELIKDKRFVLVGRGIYALSEWGYKRGTVKEVVEEILRNAKKPLSREEILKEVMKVRQVKKSTVIINLNTFFSRIGKNAYTLKK